KAVAERPESASYRNTLGTVLYRAGHFEEAIRRLREGMAIGGQGGGPLDWFALAMAHQRLGHPGEARRWLDRAERGMGERRSSDLELSRFRREAESLIGSPTK